MPVKENFNQVAGEVKSIGWAITQCQVGNISAPIQIYIFDDKLSQDQMIAEDFIVQFQLQLNSNLSLHQVIDNQIIDIETNFS